MSLKFENIQKSYTTPDGGIVDVLTGVDFEIEDGSFVSIMGPSGCGKTTLLNVISGLVEMGGGTITQNGSEIAQDQIPYTYVFQEPRLLNWRTVEDNIKFALDAQGVPGDAQQSRIDMYLEMVGLGENKQSYPLQLSGGMRQRVGLARALAVEKPVILMDEPFSALDEITAQQLRQDVLDLWRSTDRTIVFITHNISEAVYLSDKILFMNADGEFFSRERIDVPRPRVHDSSELLEIQKRLLKAFFDTVQDS